MRVGANPSGDALCSRFKIGPNEENDPSGGAATGAVFFIGCNVGDVAPGNDQATAAIIVPSFNGITAPPALLLCFTYELVQIDL